jgi:1,3-beta-glucan synthase
MLHQDLEAIWHKSPLHVLPNSYAIFAASTDLFVALFDAFGFQADSVKNQCEHLASLWHSHVAMVADRFIERGEPVNEEVLLDEALGDLHCELLDGFARWRQQFLEFEEARFDYEFGQIPAVGGAGAKLRKTLAPGVQLASRVQLVEISTFLLCWGEAGNLRFMPEVIYFITELALRADEGLSSLGSGEGSSGRYLAHIVRPIYNVVFDEWYDHVEINGQNGRDKPKLHDHCEAFLPPDVANYDDWNELFCDPENLVAGLQCTGGKKLFEEPHAKRFSALPHMNWQASLQAAKVKSHRELHSLWGVFATTHRLWLLHVLLFLSCSVFVAGDAPKTLEGELPLLGQGLASRLSAVCLVVPLHALVWFIARQQVTGRAIWKKGLTVPALLRKTLQFLLGALPLFTYALLRFEEEDSRFMGSLSWICFFCMHMAVTAAQLLLLLFMPIGMRKTCQLPKQIAGFMRPFAWMFAGEPGWIAWQPTPVEFRICIMRYFFWIAVLAVKCIMWLNMLKSVVDASEGLHVPLIERQSPSQITQVFASTYWLSGTLLWMVLWGIAFIAFVADTQLWFVIGCTLLGVLTAFMQRGCSMVSSSTEDSMAKIPERFSKKVLPYCPSCTNTTPGAAFSHKFPPVWDRIIEFMRYEDKIDAAQSGDVIFEPGASGGNISWKKLETPVGDAQGSGRTRMVRLPHILRKRGSCERWMMEWSSANAHWRFRTTNADALWRFRALSRGLSLPMPRPFRAPYIPGLTILIPHYSEEILMEKDALFQAGNNIEVPLIDWLKARYENEFIAFTHRMQVDDPEAWTATGTDWHQYSDEQWKKVARWASMRTQTLWRTVAGMCLYHHALQVHYEVQGDCGSKMSKVWNASDVFTCLVSMQLYKSFDDRHLKETNLMLDKFPDCLKVAFIDSEDKGSASGQDLVHSKQARRYYSCLIDKHSRVLDCGRRVPHLRVELPGYPILGDGKGDNQNSAIPFMRGSFSQTVDANQGAYFEQMLLMPCALGEFRTQKRGDGLSKRIVGFPEHITSDIGSIGDFAASAEMTFGTILQRAYAKLGARMHYGHPDLMSSVFMMQQGGVSKATKTVNLSEDIFAGMDFTLRGEGRKIVHKEYFHLAKGRNLGFNTVLGFFFQALIWHR